MLQLPLLNGKTIPALGLGTWDLRGEDCANAVTEALKLGYRHIDTAEFYENEAEIGKALARSGVPRKEIFLTTKIWTNHFHAADFKNAAEGSLRKLHLDHVDLLLIHWPSDAVPLAETMGALCQLAKEGKTLSIGVSNFSVAQLQEAVSLSSVPLAVNQVKFNLMENKKELLNYAKLRGIHLTAYTPLGKGNFLLNPVLSEVARKYGKTSAQTALRWLVQQGLSAVPKSTREKHLGDNLRLFDFELDEKDMAALERMES